MLNSITTNQNYRPESFHMATYESVVVNAIRSRVFLFEKEFNMGKSKFKRRKVLGICKYCGNNAYYQFKNGVLCCENNTAKCSVLRKIASEAKTGNKNPAKRPEVRKKISEANKGRKLSKETRKKQSIAKKGIKKSKEFCNNRSIRMKKYNPMKRPEIAKKVAIAMTGRTGKASSRFGKTHTKEVCEAQKQRMLNGGSEHSLSFVKNPSKPQIELFELVKEVFPETQIEYWSLKYRIDIAIPDKWLAIEYDGSYWHQDQKADNKRQKELESIGWKFLRYRDYIPNINELRRDLETII